MPVLSVDGLKANLREARAPCVSLFLPTHRSGTETAQDPIRLDNLVREATRQLGALGHDGRVIDRLLAPAIAMAKDAAFWRYQSDGLAILCWDGGHAAYRVPIHWPELCVAGDRLHVKPLLPMIGGNGHFHVLALSQNAVRLFEGSRDGLRPLDLHDIPQSLREVVGYDVEQKALQFRTPGPASGTGAMRGALFHGHGAGSDDQKAEIEKFLRAVDDGVRWLLKGTRGPLILAGAEPVASMFRQFSKLHDLQAEGIAGNFDADDGRALFDRAWPLVAPLFDKDREKLVDRIREGLGTGRAVQRIEEVVAAARDGRIDAMLAATDAFRWGRAGEKIEVHEQREDGDLDLIDLAAAECLLHGGSVHAVRGADVPGDRAVVAAALRF
jgi:hypothetical protein